MKYHLKMMAILLLMISNYSQSQTTSNNALSLEEITQIGVYVKGEKSYVPFSHINNSNFPEFKHLGAINSLQRANKQLELIVYIESSLESQLTFVSRKLSLVIKTEEIVFKVSPLDKKNMYKLTTTAKIEDGSFLYLPNMGGWNQVYAVFLGNKEKETVKFFSDTTMRPTYSALYNLQESIKSFPKNKELSKLLPVWKKIKEKESQDKSFNYISKTWGKYKKTEKIAQKISYLNEIQRKLTNFLTRYPKNGKEDLIKKYQNEIKKELPKLKRMI